MRPASLADVPAIVARLATAVAAAVRAWRDLRALALVRRSLDGLLDALAVAPVDAHAVASALVAQVSALLAPGSSVALVRSHPSRPGASVYAGSGRFADGAACAPIERDTVESRSLADGSVLALVVATDAPLTAHNRTLCVRCLDAALGLLTADLHVAR